ncbi:MAG: hypothetical protein ACKO0Z_25480 [Betaproteobacteria bacterium]
MKRFVYVAVAILSLVSFVDAGQGRRRCPPTSPPPIPMPNPAIDPYLWITTRYEWKLVLVRRTVWVNGIPVAIYDTFEWRLMPVTHTTW